MNLLYSAVLAAALLLSLPYWLLQMLRSGKYRQGLGERMGRVPARLTNPSATTGGERTIWIHAVSVGEVLGASGVIRELRSRYPDRRLVVSTTTATAQKIARERFGDANVFFFPLDFSTALRPYFNALRPELIVVAETELWPNFFRLARRRGVRVAVINARISDRSFPRYRFVSRWLAPVLACVDLFLAQTDEDARRLVAIGAAPDRVKAVGNLKFDIPAGSESPLVEALRDWLLPGVDIPVIICGSTVEGEESILIDVFGELRPRFPSLLMVIAPRHPERFGPVTDLLAASGVPFIRRSQWNQATEVMPGIFLLDSLGELADLYQVASVAFVGGSLVPRGGHNILEAARFGVPIVVGPHTENFREIIRTFRAANAVKIADASSLASAFAELLSDAPAARALGGRARDTWRQNTGATSRTLAHLQMLLPRRPKIVEMPRKENA